MKELKSSNDEMIKLIKDLRSKDDILTKYDYKIIELKKVEKIIKACEKNKWQKVTKDELSDNSTAHEHKISKVDDTCSSNAKFNKSPMNEDK